VLPVKNFLDLLRCWSVLLNVIEATCCFEKGPYVFVLQGPSRRAISAVKADEDQFCRISSRFEQVVNRPSEEVRGKLFTTLTQAEIDLLIPDQPFCTGCAWLSILAKQLIL
jgi:hypothetical protein